MIRSLLVPKAAAMNLISVAAAVPHVSIEGENFFAEKDAR